MRSLTGLPTLFLLFLISITTYSQRLDYWIIHKDDTVGVLNVERKAVGNQLHYKLNSKVDVNFIVHLLILNNMTIIYENGKLISADVLQTSNRGVFDADVKIKSVNDKYHVVKNKSAYVINEKEIHWSVGRMYFEEPLGVKAVLTEDNGKMIALESGSKGNYNLKVSFPSTFTYKNGQMVKMEAQTIVGSIYFIRK